MENDPSHSPNQIGKFQLDFKPSLTQQTFQIWNQTGNSAQVLLWFYCPIEIRRKLERNDIHVRRYILRFENVLIFLMFIKIYMWPKCGWYVAEIWLKYGWHLADICPACDQLVALVGNIWLKCGWYVADMLLRCWWDVVICGQHLVDIWLKYNWQVADMWLTCGWHVADI